jgi:acyl carrier protein
MEELEEISAMVCQLGGLGRLAPDDDFYAAGFGSMLAMQLLMELEETYAVDIPDDDFIGARTPRALCAVVARVRKGEAPCEL